MNKQTGITMTENEMRSIIEETLLLDKKYRSQWDILSLFPNPKTSTDAPKLALVHYNETYDPDIRDNSPVRNLRGPIIDIRNKIVIAESYGYPESIPVYSPIMTTLDEQGKPKTYEFQSEMKVYHTETNLVEQPKITVGTRVFPADAVQFFPGYETVVMRVFKFAGRVFYATHKSLYGETSNFGEAKFSEIYNRLNGPELQNPDGTPKIGSQQLFNPRLDYSPYCYIFLVCDNKIRLATSTRDNRIIFVAMKEMWSPVSYAKEPGDCYFCEADDDFTNSTPIVFTPQLSQNADDNPITRQSEIDTSIANAILFPDKFANHVQPNFAYPDNGKYEPLDQKHSTQPNIKQLTIVYNDTCSKIVGVDYVPPFQPETDERLMGGDFIIMYYRQPNGNILLFHLESIAYNYRVKVTDNDPNYYHRFVVEAHTFVKEPVEKLKLSYPFPSNVDFSTADARLRYWAILMLNAVRIEARDEVANFYVRYQKDIREVANFILHNVSIEDEEEKKRLNEKTIQRFNNLRDVALRGFGGETPYNSLVSMLHKETGVSLYKIMSTVKKITELRRKVAAGLLKPKSIAVTEVPALGAPPASPAAVGQE